MAHLLLSAAHKSSGKTTVTIGLCAALRERGLAVQPFKKGPDYIDPMWLAVAAGRSCYNLDFNTMSPDAVRGLFSRKAVGADVSLVEGNKGLHDGVALDGSNSNAALARLLEAPVVLVLDTRGMTRGVAPLIRGFQSFDPAVSIRGVVLNQVGGRRHEAKLRSVIEHYTDVPVLGAVRRHRDLEITERHLGLVPSNELQPARAIIGRIAVAVGDQVDLEALWAVARGAPAMPAGRVEGIIPRPDVRVAIARDAAFGFYYADDLEALRSAGADLVPFDALRDATLPEVDGLLIGGGFPETQAAALEANVGLRRSIRQAIEAGMPCYAECGGLMYLCRRICWRGETHEMAGVLPADVVMQDRPQGRGYVRLEETADHPWRPAQGGKAPPAIPGHEFHYSHLENLDPGLRFAYRVERGTGLDGKRDGIVYKHLLANYAHLRNLHGNPWTDRFLAFVRAHRK